MDDQVEVELRESRKRLSRPRSASYIAVRSAVYQLTSFSDFDTEKIGAGFFADVFKVRHRTTGEVLVLKLNKSRKNSKQMLSEIQLMNRLSHHNILRFKGSCVHEGHLHALTEYINGGSLEDLLHDPSIELSWSVRVKIARDIARGMAYLHSRGVFHRDLSSRNCLIQHEANGKLRTVVADFGLAAKFKQARRRSHTEVVGSPYWMAPECLNGKEYCEQADVFSYGIVLAEIMARVPADPDFMPRTRYFGVDFVSLRKLCVGCPEELWQLMVQCCQMDPDERPIFEEAVQILEQVDLALDDSASQEQASEPDNMSCYSEPALRLRDWDEELSSASEGDLSVEARGRSYGQQLDSLGSVESFSSIGSSGAEEEGVARERRHGISGGGLGKMAISSADNMASRPANDLGDLKESELVDRSSDSLGDGVALGQLGYAECCGSRHTLVAEDEINSNIIKKREGERGEGGGTREEHVEEVPGGTMVQGSGTNAPDGTGRSWAVGQVHCAEPGDLTPRVCNSPALHHSSRKWDLGSPHGEFGENQPPVCVPERTLTPPTEQTPVIATIQNDSTRYMAFVTPSGQCTSPIAHSMASSDFSFRLPTPSFPWAPPPSPFPSQIGSHSLPASPTVTRRRFRFSQDIASTADIATFGATALAPMTSDHDSSPSLDTVWHKVAPLMYAQEPVELRYKGRSSRNGDILERDSYYHPVHSWKRESLCMNLHDEHFSHMDPDPRQRNRSRSSPGLIPQRLPTDYSLTLARQSSPNSGDSRRTSGYIYNCYNIKLRRNYRLSSSAPDLFLLCNR